MGLIMMSYMMVLGGIYLIFALAWWILQIIANWNIFTKAGEAGWKSIIPIYGDYVSYADRCTAQNYNRRYQHHVLCKTVKSLWPRDWFCNWSYFFTTDFFTDSWLRC